MARKRTSKRPKPARRSERSARRIAAWILVSACWIFLAFALFGFDGADWPSQTVSAHNDPTTNPTGLVGSALAYWILGAIGFGAWVLLGWGAPRAGCTRAREGDLPPDPADLRRDTLRPGGRDARRRLVQRLLRHTRCTRWASFPGTSRNNCSIVSTSSESRSGC